MIVLFFQILSKYQEELLPAESFEEFCDLIGKLLVSVLFSLN